MCFTGVFIAFHRFSQCCFLLPPKIFFHKASHYTFPCTRYKGRIASSTSGTLSFFLGQEKKLREYTRFRRIKNMVVITEGGVNHFKPDKPDVFRHF